MNLLNNLIKLSTAVINHPALPIAFMASHYFHEHKAYTNIIEFITKF